MLGSVEVGRCPVKRSRHEPPLSERELSERYAYLVDVLPDSIVVRAHVAVLEHVSPALRQEAITVLREAQDRNGSDQVDDATLAAVISAAVRRDPALRDSLAPVLAAGFIEAAPVASYFSTGGGSVMIDQQPPWVQRLVAHDGAPIDSTAVHRRIGYSGVDMLP